MKIQLAFSNKKGPRGESKEEIIDIILKIMEPYNMHNVPSPEMAELEIEKFYLAEIGGHYVGAAGYKMISPTQGKTTLLAVVPESGGEGVGHALQKTRIDKMRELGATSVITNSDRPETISWYKKQGYTEIGTIPKIHSFGWDGVDYWTTLLLEL